MSLTFSSPDYSAIKILAIALFLLTLVVEFFLLKVFGAFGLVLGLVL